MFKGNFCNYGTYKIYWPAFGFDINKRPNQCLCTDKYKYLYIVTKCYILNGIKKQKITQLFSFFNLNSKINKNFKMLIENIRMKDHTSVFRSSLNTEIIRNY